MGPAGTRELSGTAVLRSVSADLRQYQETIARMNRQVSVIRFAAQRTDPELWQLRMEASRVSAEQKVKAFNRLGLHVDHQVLAATTGAPEFAALIEARNADPATVAVIVQYPPPQHLAPVVHQLAPEKDIDGLLEDQSLQPSCATADGIARVVRPFAPDDPAIAVVGGRGFVGRGVVRLLQADGLRVDSLDAGDDLRRTRSADIVVSATGRPHLLTDAHVRPHQRLVVDSGFMPQSDGSVAGDVHPSVRNVPQYITPVPGGVGPIEMAVLMDRIVRQEVDRARQPWSMPQMPYLNRSEIAALGNLPSAASAVTAPRQDDEHGRRPGQPAPGVRLDRGEISR